MVSGSDGLVQFEATAAAYVRDEDIDTEMIVVAEREDGAGSRLEIQRSLDVTSQDIDLGMDTYCLVNENGVSHYGGVTGWQLDGDVLRISLAPDAAETFRSSGFEVTLRISAGARDSIEPHLRRLLA